MLRTFRQKRPGFISLMAIVAAIFLFIIGLGLLNLGFNRRLYSIRSNHQLAASCAADYALTKAIHEMNLRLPAVGTSNLPAADNNAISGSDAKYSYTVTYDAAKYPPYSITAQGTSGHITKTVICDLRLKGIFEYAILTKNTLDIGSCSQVTCDGCGPVPLRIGTTNNPTASIILKPGSTIDGDILLGQNGTPSLIVGSGATYGNVYAVATDFDLPEPALPTDFVAASSNIGAIMNGQTISSGKYTSEKVDLGTNKTLIINGIVELYVTGDIKLGNSAGFILAPNARLTIYLAGTLNAANSAEFNNDGEPNQLSIVGLTSNPITITFKHGAAFNGTIYAPYSNVTLNNDVKINGSVIANNYKQDNNAIFTYDASLRTASQDDLFVRFVPKYWREQ